MTDSNYCLWQNIREDLGAAVARLLEHEELSEDEDKAMRECLDLFWEVLTYQPSESYLSLLIASELHAMKYNIAIRRVITDKFTDYFILVENTLNEPVCNQILSGTEVDDILNMLDDEPAVIVADDKDQTYHNICAAIENYLIHTNAQK